MLGVRSQEQLADFRLGVLESLDSERPQRLVKVSPFLLGRYPVTQAQWRVVAGYKRERRELILSPP